MTHEELVHLVFTRLNESDGAKSSSKLILWQKQLYASFPHRKSSVLNALP